MQLDQEQLNALTPAQRAQYMALEQLFAQPGWKYVVALAKEKAASLVQRAAFANNWAENRLAVGNGVAWNEIAQLEEQTAARYAQLISEADAEKEILRINEEGDFE